MCVRQPEHTYAYIVINFAACTDLHDVARLHSERYADLASLASKGTMRSRLPHVDDPWMIIPIEIELDLLS